MIAPTFNSLNSKMTLLVALLVVSYTQLAHSFELGSLIEQFSSHINPSTPLIQWPSSFELSLSSNDPGLNITEKIYFDKDAKKLRIQVFYSILGLEPSKAIDIIIDENEKRVALKTDVDCKQTHFKQSLSAISLFFTLWSAFTDYEGEVNGLHKFKVSHIGNHESSPKFYFFFNNKKELESVKLEQPLIGGIELQALRPVQAKNFTKEDFEYDDCDEINSMILEEAKTFVSFMQTIMEELMGKEDYMLGLLKGKYNLINAPLTGSQALFEEEFED